MYMIKILIIFIILLFLIYCSLAIVEPMNNYEKGDLYLLLEANGFNIPEIQHTKMIVDKDTANEKFKKVIVVANSAKYKDSSDGQIMINQWENNLVKNLGLPIEKWVFVCCSSKVLPADKLLKMLTTQFSDIKGFLIDSEDNDSYPHSIQDFTTVFNDMGSKYKYAIVGGLRNTIPPKDKYGIIFDKFLGEVYTEGDLGKYNFYKKLPDSINNTSCVSTQDDGIKQFWNSVQLKLGNSNDIIPTVCGSGNCQEKMFGDDCFDERLSNKDITKILNGNTTSKKDFAIWYGSGQQFSCSPTNNCVKLDENSCNNSSTCTWMPYKKNPITHKDGVCYGNIDSSLWGCSTKW